MAMNELRKEVEAAAMAELNRANALVKEDLISRSDVDQSLASRNQNKALYDAARQQLELARVNLNLRLTAVSEKLILLKETMLLQLQGL